MRALLLRHGGDVNACASGGITALDFASQCVDNGGVVRALLEAGADIEAKMTVNSNTPLYSAAVSKEASSSSTMNVLLEGGADVNECNTRDETPLHRACVCSNVAGVELLL